MPEHLLARPAFTTIQAEQIAADHFGIPGKARPLAGERDQNFCIESHHDQFVLKISNYDADFQFIEFENQALQLCFAVDGVVTPNVIRSTDRQPIIQVRDGGSDKSCFARCLSFVPGRPLAECPVRTPQLLHRIGAGLATIDNALRLLNHDRRARRQLKWDLSRGPEIVQKNLPRLDRRQGDLVGHYLKLHQAHAHRIAELDASVIHNDPNDYNWIIESSPEQTVQSVGLIDFGDLVYATAINDLAIACAYLMLDRDEPAEDAAQFVAGYHHVHPLTDAELSVLFPLIGLRLCQSVSIAAEQKSIRPDDDYLTVTEQPAWTLLERMAEWSPAEIAERFFAARHSGKTGGDNEKKELIRSRQQRLLPSLSLAYRRPLQIVRGKGQYLYDQNEATYLDCVNNICHVGHGHLQVVNALSQQAAVLNTNTRYLHENIIRLASRLTATLPESLQVCTFVNSGSEANDLALRMGWNHVKRKDVVVIDHAYHGHTAATIEVSPYKFNGPGGTGQPDHVHVLPLPDGFRGEFRYEQEDFAASYARQAVHFIEQLVAGGKPPGLFIAESLLGCGGQIPLPADYLRNVYQVIRRHGGVCIADEVQVGFGRVGKTYWGFELQNVVPDIVTVGKPFGNGHPLAAVVTTTEIAESFDNGMEYFNSFGGNPVSCAVGLAVMDVIENEQLRQNADRVGRSLLAELHDLKDRFPERLGDVRGHGFFLGLEFTTNARSRQPDAPLAEEVVEAMRNKNILLSTDGPDRNVIKFKPPMVFDDANADRLVATLDRVLARLIDATSQ